MVKHKSLMTALFVGLGLMAGWANAEIFVYEPFVGTDGEAFWGVDTESVNLGPWSEPGIRVDTDNAEFVEFPAYTDPDGELLPTKGVGAVVRGDLYDTTVALDAPATFAGGESVWIGLQAGLRDKGGSGFDRQHSRIRFHFDASDLELRWDSGTQDNQLVQLALQGATGGATTSGEDIPYPAVGEPVNEFILIRVDFGSGDETIRLWRNPSLLSQPADEDALLTGTQELGNTLSAITARSQAYHTELILDEIRIGATFYDVVGRSGPPTNARSPQPAHQSIDVPRDGTVLAWRPGELAASHDVYFGKSFEDVNTATPGSGVFKGNQIQSTYALDRLEFKTSYYWRIDEVNSPPDSTVFRGAVWSFTTEPVGYPVDGADITATASSVGGADFGPEKTIDGSGLDQNDQHSTEAMDMWLSGDEPLGAWIQYEFDKVQKLHQMWVWNSNQIFEGIFGFGFKDVTIEYSTDGAAWTALADVPQFTRAPGAAGYAHDTTVDFGGAVAKYVKLTATSNWGGVLPQYGLSEVRFFSMPVSAREPSPASSAVDVDPDVTLTWRAGRDTATHNLYLSTDRQAVIDGTVPAVTAAGASYSTTLDLGSTYYWRVDEVNDAETPTVWQADVWDFTTQEYLVVEDFEDYNDYPPYEIYTTWLDGYENPTNGSQVGYLTPPSVETTIVHGGVQSMPLFYSNTGGAAYSEAIRTFAVPQDWTKYGIKTLGLWFYGTAGNTGQLYVKINGVKVPYDGDAGNLAVEGWQPWNIDLTTLSVNLQSITSLAIGIDGNAAAGTLYVDDIRLYAYERRLVTPAEPDPATLQGYWPLDGNLNDSSGNGRNGTPMGGPTFVAGKVGQAISLDGVDDFVEITGYKGILQSPWTLSCWVNTTTAGDLDILSWGTEGGGLKVEFRLDDGRPRIEHGNGNSRGDAQVHDGNWHHVVAMLPEGGLMEDVMFYLDGGPLDVFQIGSGTNPFITTEGLDLNIGRSGPLASRYFTGMIDEVRMYDRALSLAEIAWCAGRTVPFDEPF